jgi:3-deoxy-manno-octulosonate cytidylyltransferase (CMP-KDO synthetase)
LSEGPVVAIIPARYGSTRFPGKPLADKTGKPLIRHVVERVRGASSVTRVIVATDDDRILKAVRGFGCEVVMTRSDHPNGTSRLAEVAGAMAAAEAPVLVNVQGDEPEIEPGVIDELVAGLLADAAAPMATLASDFNEGEDPGDPNIVKLVTCVVGGRRRAMYFSRSLIPFDRDRRGLVGPLKHPGLYAYRRGFLLRYAGLAATPLEQAEQLEQLRALEHGYAIAVVRTVVRHHGIDTPQQYEEFVKRVKAQG